MLTSIDPGEADKAHYMNVVTDHQTRRPSVTYCHPPINTLQNIALLVDTEV